MKPNELNDLLRSPVLVLITATACTVVLAYVAIEAHKQITTGDSKLFS